MHSETASAAARIPRPAARSAERLGSNKGQPAVAGFDTIDRAFDLPVYVLSRVRLVQPWLDHYSTMIRPRRSLFPFEAGDGRSIRRNQATVLPRAPEA